MNVVAIRTDTSEVFESQSYDTDTQKALVETAIQADAQAVGIAVSISYLSDSDLEQKIAV